MPRSDSSPDTKLSHEPIGVILYAEPISGDTRALPTRFNWAVDRLGKLCLGPCSEGGQLEHETACSAPGGT